MRVLIATNSWHPQVNGVFRTLTSLAKAAEGLGVSIEFLSPEGFPTFQLPTYPGLRLAIPNRRGIAERIEAVKPDAIHFATEGPIGFAVRAYCRHQSRRELYDAFSGIHFRPLAHSGEPCLHVLRWFHSGATVTMVATPVADERLWSLAALANLGMWTRGVDVDLFRPDRAIDLGLRTSHFHDRRTRRGREEFGSVPCRSIFPVPRSWSAPARKRPKLKREFPDAKFLGPRRTARSPRIWPQQMFLFSQSHRHIRHRSARGAGKRGTDCSVSGDRPEDVVGDRPIGVLDEDLGRACIEALKLSREACRQFALECVVGKQCKAISRATSVKWRAAMVASLKPR